MKQVIVILFLLIQGCAIADGHTPTQQSNTPPANSFFYTVYSTECATFINQIFSTEYGLRTVCKNQSGEWGFITEPSFFESDVDTREKADATYSNALGIINADLTAALGGGGSEPDSGVERIEFLLLNKTIVVDDQLTIEQ